MTSADRPLRRLATSHLIVVAIAATAAITCTYVLAGSAADPETKMSAFAAIIGAFLLFCFGLYLIPSLRWAEIHDARSEDAADPLATLADLATFIAGSVRTKDAFRLIASRLRAVVPVETAALYLLDKKRQRLRIAEVDPADAIFGNTTYNADLCFVRRGVHIGGSGEVAIPLKNENEPFAVLELRFGNNSVPEDHSIFDEITERVSPLILASLAFERTAANALTDATTDLPNERALHLILENQLAETQRSPDERPLTLLALDIRGFSEINQRFGHAAGDRVLTFVAQAIRNSLRQMDFLARCRDDEFLAVLPTASKEISQEITQRIMTSLFGRQFRITDDEYVEPELNFGFADFGQDGETVEQLIATARVRKQQQKTASAGKVLWFSREMQA